MKNESALSSKMRKYAEKLGVGSFRMPDRDGIPDLVFFKEGRCLFVETKNPNGGGKMETSQVKRHYEMLRDYKTKVILTEDYDEFVYKLREWLDEMEA